MAEDTRNWGCSKHVWCCLPFQHGGPCRPPHRARAAMLLAVLLACVLSTGACKAANSKPITPANQINCAKVMKADPNIKSCKQIA